jgi:murein DD-endopeptidase MepM/ murein hydrolase activator NlpD
MKSLRNGLTAAVCVLAVCAIAQQSAHVAPAVPVSYTRPAAASSSGPAVPAHSPHGPLTPAVSLTPFPADMLAIPVAGVDKSKLVDTWGQSRVGHLHTAIDIMAPRGTDVVAAAPGTVLKLFTSRAGGLTVYVADPSKTWIYYYAHLDSYAPGLHAGMPVAQGDILGFVGTTGNASPDAPHLHFEIEQLPVTGEWWRGEPVNPYPILMARGQTFVAAR